MKKIVNFPVETYLLNRIGIKKYDFVSQTRSSYYVEKYKVE